MPNDKLVDLKAEHAPRLDRQSFDTEVARLWPEASKLPLWKIDASVRESMYSAHVAFGLSPLAIVAGFADTFKSGYLR